MMRSAITDGTSSKVSIKRVVVLILILLLVVVILAHVFFSKTIEDYIYDGLIEAVIWSMGFIGSEKFVEAIPSFMTNRRGRTKQQPPSIGNNPADGAPAAAEENLI